MFKKFFKKDIISKISQFLNPLDIYFLRSTCKHIYRKINSSNKIIFSEFLAKNLLELTEESENLKNLLPLIDVDILEKAFLEFLKKPFRINKNIEEILIVLLGKPSPRQEVIDCIKKYGWIFQNDGFIQCLRKNPELFLQFADSIYESLMEKHKIWIFCPPEPKYIKKFIKAYGHHLSEYACAEFLIENNPAVFKANLNKKSSYTKLIYEHHGEGEYCVQFLLFLKQSLGKKFARKIVKENYNRKNMIRLFESGWCYLKNFAIYNEELKLLQKKFLIKNIRKIISGVSECKKPLAAFTLYYLILHDVELKEFKEMVEDQSIVWYNGDYFHGNLDALLYTNKDISFLTRVPVIEQYICEKK